jgi:tripartite-type tricarboxylate transporter receptor subunit TctC
MQACRQARPRRTAVAWLAISVLASPVLAQLGRALQQVASSAEFAQAMQRIGNVAHPGSPELMRQMAQTESAKWGALIQRLNIKLE